MENPYFLGMAILLLLNIESLAIYLAFYWLGVILSGVTLPLLACLL